MRFYLHIATGNGHARDEEGRNFPDFAAARAEAVASAHEIMADALRSGQAIDPDWAIEVCDAAHNVLDVLPMQALAIGAGPPTRHRRLYGAVHHAYLLLAPDFTILEANPAYLRATLTDYGTINRRALFDVFPDNPGDPRANGVRNLTASLNTVLREKRPHFMATQRYDIRRRDGTWEERHWKPVNLPVLDDNGEIEFIVHNVADVTSDVRTRGRA